MDIVHAPRNVMPRITQLWAVVSSDEGGEGLCASKIDGMMLPLIAADEARLESLLPLAHEAARVSGKKVKVVRFTVREDLMDIDP